MPANCVSVAVQVRIWTWLTRGKFWSDQWHHCICETFRNGWMVYTYICIYIFMDIYITWSQAALCDSACLSAPSLCIPRLHAIGHAREPGPHKKKSSAAFSSRRGTHTCIDRCAVNGISRRQTIHASIRSLVAWKKKKLLYQERTAVRVLYSSIRPSSHHRQRNWSTPVKSKKLDSFPLILQIWLETKISHANERVHFRTIPGT